MRAMDQLCTGRRECTVDVLYFDSVVFGCEPDRYKFLSAEYICVEGE